MYYIAMNFSWVEMALLKTWIEPVAPTPHMWVTHESAENGQSYGAGPVFLAAPVLRISPLNHRQ